MIAAVEKAESLARIAKEQGAPLSEFVLTLTKTEAFELLDHLGAGGMGWFANHRALLIDIALAKVHGTPFEVLDNFQLLGFNIEALH